MMYSILLVAPEANAASSLPTLLMFGAMAIVFYFFMIRPQQKKAKEQKKFTEELKKGDDVITIGGAHGRIAEIEGDTVVLEVERGGRIRFSKSAVSMDSTKNVKK